MKKKDLDDVLKVSSFLVLPGFSLYHILGEKMNRFNSFIFSLFLASYFGLEISKGLSNEIRYGGKLGKDVEYTLLIKDYGGIGSVYFPFISKAVDMLVGSEKKDVYFKIEFGDVFKCVRSYELDENLVGEKLMVGEFRDEDVVSLTEMSLEERVFGKDVCNYFVEGINDKGGIKL